MGQIELAKAIEALRAELEAARKVGDGHDLRFELGSLDSELQAAVTAEASGSAGIKWWLLEARVEGAVSRATTQTVKLSLTPKIVDGDGGRSGVLLDGVD